MYVNISSYEGEALNEAKKVAAYEITKLVHGEEEAKKAEEAANSLFGGKGSSENMPEVVLEEGDSIIDAIVKAGFATSKGQAKTLISQGGVSLNDEKVTDMSYKLSIEELKNGAILKKGKKSFCKLVL